MTLEECKRQMRDIERRGDLARQLADRKHRREQRAKREVAVRESARLLQHLPPERIDEPQPCVVMPSGFGGLRPSPRPADLARRSQRVDQILQSLY